MQTAASQLPQLAAQIVAGLRRDGPALFCIYTACEQPQGAVPTYLRCASAVESRAFPSFVYDPDRGADWASRFSLAGSPQIDRGLAHAPVCLRDLAGPGGEPDAGVYLCRFPNARPAVLTTTSCKCRARNGTPIWCLWHSISSCRVRRPWTRCPMSICWARRIECTGWCVRRGLVAFARKCLAAWRGLQTLNQIDGAQGLPLAEQEPTRGRDEEQTAASPVSGQPLGADPAPADGVPPAAPRRRHPRRSGRTAGQAYVDTDMCTTCDDMYRSQPRDVRLQRGKAGLHQGHHGRELPRTRRSGGKHGRSVAARRLRRRRPSASVCSTPRRRCSASRRSP